MRRNPSSPTQKSMQKRGVPMFCVCEKQQRLCARDTNGYKRPRSYRSWRDHAQTHSQTHSLEVLVQGRQLRNCQNIQGGTKLTNFRNWAEAERIRATFSRDGGAGMCQYSFVELFSYTAGPTWQAPYMCSPLTWLTPYPLPQWFPETTSLHTTYSITAS